jgi:hypothetical protein
MSQIPAITGAQLTNALHALGVHFILGGSRKDISLRRQPARLIAGLAGSNEARLRLALIPLFLEHPEFSGHVRAACASLEASARLTLQCYYSAAVLFQQKYRERLAPVLGPRPALPDYFSQALGVAQGDPETGLQMLATRHQELSGEKVNWLGTYRHAVQIWFKGLGLSDA